LSIARPIPPKNGLDNGSPPLFDAGVRCITYSYSAEVKNHIFPPLRERTLFKKYTEKSEIFNPQSFDEIKPNFSVYILEQKYGSK